MANLGSLVVSLEANMAKFNDDMNRASQVTQQAMANVEAATARAADSIKLIGLSMAGLAAGVSFQALVSQFDAVIESAAGLKDMAEKTGASVENLSGLSAVAKLVGQDMGGVEAAMTKFAKNLAGTSDESKGTAHALDTLGLKMRDLRQMDSAESLKLVADKLAEYRDGVGKTAMAQDLFGKSGAQLLPFLKDLAESGDLVVKTTAAQALQADDYEKGLKRLTIAKNSLYKSITVELLPAANDFLSWLLEAKSSVGSLTGAVQQMAADGSIQKWASDVSATAKTVVTSGLDAVKTLREHKEAVEAVALAYAAIKGSAILTPWIEGLYKTAAANVQAVAAAYQAKTAAEAQARASMEAAVAKLAEADATVASARATVLATSGNVQLLYTANNLVPALRAKAAAEVEVAAATAAHAAAMEAASLSGRTMSAASGMAASAVSALGGPLGIATGLLIAGAGAWAMWGNEATKAAKEASKAKDDIERAVSTLERLKRVKMFGAGDEGELQAGLERVQAQISVVAQSRSPGAQQKLAELRKQEEEIQAAIYSLGSMKPAASEPEKPSLNNYQSNLGTTKAVKEQKDDYDRLMRSITEKIAAQEAELSSTAKLTDAAKEYAKFLADVQNGYVKLTTVELAKLTTQWDAFLRNADALQAKARDLAYNTARLSIGDIAGSFGRDNQARIDSMTIMPQALREQEAALRAVDEKAREAEKSIRRLFADGKIDADQYNKLIGELTDTINGQKDAVRGLLEQQQRLNASWEYGAAGAVQKYLDGVRNMAAQTDAVVTRAFGSMEDALTQFVTKGKLDFKGLVDSIAADMVRLSIRQQITGPLAQQIQGAGGLGTLFGGISGLFGNSAAVAAKTSEDYIDAGGMGQGGSGMSGMFARLVAMLPSYDVGTDYVPRDMIAKIHAGERIVPAAQNKPGFGGITQHLTINVGGGGVDSRTAQQIALQAGMAVQRAAARNG